MVAWQHAPLEEAAKIDRAQIPHVAPSRVERDVAKWRNRGYRWFLIHRATMGSPVVQPMRQECERSLGGSLAIEEKRATELRAQDRTVCSTAGCKHGTDACWRSVQGCKCVGGIEAEPTRPNGTDKELSVAQETI
jgi:hypothetical protein